MMWLGFKEVVAMLKAKQSFRAVRNKLIQGLRSGELALGNDSDAQSIARPCRHPPVREQFGSDSSAEDTCGDGAKRTVTAAGSAPLPNRRQLSTDQRDHTASSTRMPEQHGLASS